MIVNVDLHLRLSPEGDHRPLGLVPLELDAAQPAPYLQMGFWVDGRRVRAEITSVHQRGGHLPHVYADEIHADELV